MSATGLDVFDKTLQTTNRWLGDIEETIGPHRQLAWHTLGAVLRTLRDRLPIEVAAHLGAQLPILVRGIFYDQWLPTREPQKWRSREEFLERVAEKMEGTRPVNVSEATRAVFATMSHYVTPELLDKVRDALPQDVRELWPATLADVHPKRASKTRDH